MGEALDGLLTFFASHHAIRAEKTLQTAGFAATLIPGPKDLSPNCGVAVRFEYANRDEALAELEAKRVKVDAVHEYRPATDDWRRPVAREEEPKRFWRRGRQ